MDDETPNKDITDEQLSEARLCQILVHGHLPNGNSIDYIMQCNAEFSLTNTINFINTALKNLDLTKKQLEDYLHRTSKLDDPDDFNLP